MKPESIFYTSILLEEIGLPQEAATILYEDNQGAVLMANAQRPMRRTRHIDLKYFGLQEWIQKDLMILHRSNTGDNYADAMTKALARTLFYWYMSFVMGQIVLEYAYKTMNLAVHRILLSVDSLTDELLILIENSVFYHGRVLHQDTPILKDWDESVVVRVIGSGK